MKKYVLVVVFVFSAFGASQLFGQDKEKTAETSKAVETQKPSEAQKTVTPLRVQIVFNEYDGDKKTSSLPYTLLVNADDKGPQAAVRIGLKVPIEISSGAAKSFQYQDLSINLDGRAEKTEDGRFLLRLNVEKFGVYVPDQSQRPSGVEGRVEIFSGQPIIQNFRSQVNLIVRDGQTIQSTVATDPITGHVVKVDVTLNVIK
ncbi:MAG: hypothetical protein WBR10_08010 [Candidatus Acidiferrum sp.]